MTRSSAATTVLSTLDLQPCPMTSYSPWDSECHELKFPVPNCKVLEAAVSGRQSETAPSYDGIEKLTFSSSSFGPNLPSEASFKRDSSAADAVESIVLACEKPLIDNGVDKVPLVEVSKEDAVAYALTLDLDVPSCSTLDQAVPIPKAVVSILSLPKVCVAHQVDEMESNCDIQHITLDTASKRSGDSTRLIESEEEVKGSISKTQEKNDFFGDRKEVRTEITEMLDEGTNERAMQQESENGDKEEVIKEQCTGNFEIMQKQGREMKDEELLKERKKKIEEGKEDNKRATERERSNWKIMLPEDAKAIEDDQGKEFTESNKHVKEEKPLQQEDCVIHPTSERKNGNASNEKKENEEDILEEDIEINNKKIVKIREEEAEVDKPNIGIGCYQEILVSLTQEMLGEKCCRERRFDEWRQNEEAWTVLEDKRSGESLENGARDEGASTSLLRDGGSGKEVRATLLQAECRSEAASTRPLVVGSCGEEDSAKLLEDEGSRREVSAGLLVVEGSGKEVGAKFIEDEDMSKESTKRSPEAKYSSEDASMKILEDEDNRGVVCNKTDEILEIEDEEYGESEGFDVHVYANKICRSSAEEDTSKEVMSSYIKKGVCQDSLHSTSPMGALAGNGMNLDVHYQEEKGRYQDNKI